MCASPNRTDGKPCELQKGHTGMHGYRMARVAAMYGAATTAYGAGSYWRMWNLARIQRC